MAYPKWCNPKDYKPGVRVKVFGYRQGIDGREGTIERFSNKNTNGEDVYKIDWGEHKGDMVDCWWIGFLKIIKPKNMRELLE